MENKINIIYEDENILAIYKPVGLIVHSDGKTKENNLTDWLLEKYPDIKGVGESMILSGGEVIDRSGIVHRLDRDTSGVMLVAKTKEAHSFLKKQFQEREIEKTYNAFVYGQMKEEKGTIDRPIGRSSTNFKLRSAQRGARGELRSAVTNWKVIKSSKDFSFLEISPKSGRTHQIRVHMKAINYPVICDKLYAPKRECALGFDRLALHSRRVVFTDLEGKKIVIEAPLPDDFEKALKELNWPLD